MRIGTMFLGKVEALEHESIQTKFFVLGVPLVPMESFYVVAEDVQGVRGQTLKDVHGASALAGYSRILLGTAAFISAIFAWIERDGSTGWALCIACTLGLIASMTLLGKLSDSEREKRQCLLRLIGTGVPPELLESHAREAQLERLQAIYAILDDTPWRDHLEDPTTAPADLLKLLYAIARYDGHSEAETLWTRIANGEAQPLRAPTIPDEAEEAEEDDEEATSAPRPKKRRRRPKRKRIPCASCDVLNGADAEFCKGCGEPIAISA